MITRPLLIILSVVALASRALPAPADSSARQVVESFQAVLMDIATTEFASFQSRFEILEPVVVATHDLDYIARLTLGRHWRTLKEGERAEFAGRFRRLAIASYAGRFPAFNGERFEIAGQDSQLRGIERVTTRLYRADGKTIAFDYLLRKTADGWQIVNILVDGVSDLALKRAEYAAVIEESGAGALLARLEEQYRRLQQ